MVFILTLTNLLFYNTESKGFFLFLFFSVHGSHVYVDMRIRAASRRDPLKSRKVYYYDGFCVYAYNLQNSGSRLKVFFFLSLIYLCTSSLNVENCKHSSEEKQHGKLQSQEDEKLDFFPFDMAIYI